MKRDEGAGVFPLFLSRVAMGRTYGGLNNGRTIEKPVAPTFKQRVIKQKGLFAGDAVDKQLFRKALDVQAKGWVGEEYKDTPKTHPQPLSVIGAGWQFARSRKKWEEKNDGLEFVVYDGSQARLAAAASRGPSHLRAQLSARARLAGVHELPSSLPPHLHSNFRG